MTTRGWEVTERIDESHTWRGIRSPLELAGFRLLALATMFFGIRYLHWRYTASLNYSALWFAIPMILAESFSFVSAGLFALNLWRLRKRTVSRSSSKYTVDVYITVYNEPPAIVRKTAEAAVKINYPHRTYILDDGRSPAIKALADELGASYISREDNRHAKAGNLNNALRLTTGDLLLYLDADQIPKPQILDRVLGYFEDDRVAFVQTPQDFYNVPAGDPFGNDAKLFYGPIQQGKDGWGAAFLCGTNVVLRREALIQLGLVYYVRDMRKELANTLQQAARAARDAAKMLKGHAELEAMIPSLQVMHLVQATIRKGQAELRRGLNLDEVISIVTDAGDGLKKLETQLDQTRSDFLEITGDLQGLEAQPLEQMEATPAQGARKRIEGNLLPVIKLQESVVQEVREAAERVQRAVAIEETPMATISVTEDLATSIRLHALGWKSIYHGEVLAQGLATEDLGSTLLQRLRWAQGTIQVMFRDNPLFKPGLSLGQRLQYSTTMFSYFYGFAALIYLLSPSVYLFTGVSPVNAYSADFFQRLLPYLLLNQFMFIYATRGLSTWRGQQYQVSLFPIWLNAFFSVIREKKLGFKVTPKTRQGGIYLHLIKPQLAISLATIVGILFGIIALWNGSSRDTTSVIVNIIWGLYNLWMLSAIIRGAVWKPARKNTGELGGETLAGFSTNGWLGGSSHANLSNKFVWNHINITRERGPQRTHSPFVEGADYGAG